MERKQLNIYYLDFEAEDRASQQPPSAHELQVRLVERDDLASRDADDTNAMYIEWREKGKIFLQEEMLELDLMMQLKLVRGSTYVGSISFPFRDVLELRRDFKQWLTVFDTLEDDVFDGTIGVSDEETPRIFVGFEIKDQSFDEDDDIQEVRAPHQAGHTADNMASKDSFVLEAKKVVESNHAALSASRHPQKSDTPDRTDVKTRPPAPPAGKKDEPPAKPTKTAEGKRDSDKKADALRSSTDAKKYASNPPTKPSTAAHTSSTSTSKTASKPLVLGSPQAAHQQEMTPTKRASHSKTHDHQVHQPPPHSLAESMQSAQSSKHRDPAKKPSRSEEMELKASELQIEIEKYARLTRLRLSLDNCHLVIEDLNRQLSSSKAENDSLSTTLATLRASHKKALKEVTDAHQRELQEALKQSRRRSDSEDRDLELA